MIPQAELDYRYRQRQQDVAPPLEMRRLPVHLIGAGGIGSNFAVMGSKLGFAITVYDADRVAPENVNSQVFGPPHLGQPKVDAVKQICLAHAGSEIRAVDNFVGGGELLAGIVVEAVDSMAARAVIWQKAVLHRAAFVDAYVSVRMGAESGSIFTVHPASLADRLWYETAGLYADEDALPLPCTGRATTYCANIAAALAVSQAKRILMNQPTYRRIDFDLDGLMFAVDE